MGVTYFIRKQKAPVLEPSYHTFKAKNWGQGAAQEHDLLSVSSVEMSTGSKRYLKKPRHHEITRRGEVWKEYLAV